MTSASFLQILDLVGTFVFAISARSPRSIAGSTSSASSCLYAVAALAGAGVVVGHLLHVHNGVSALIGAALCFGLRFMAIRHGWHLPSARLSARNRAQMGSTDDERTH